jgi:sugar phosphate isomerase/epimerase
MNTDRSVPASFSNSVSRRGFLGLAGLAVAAVGARADSPQSTSPKPDAAPAGPREMGFYISPRDPKLAERLAWLRQQGVRHVGLDGSGKFTPAELKQINRAIEQAGMQVVAVHGVGFMAHPDNDQKALYGSHLFSLDRAAAFGAGELIVHSRILALRWHEAVGFEEAAYISRLGLEKYDQRVLELLGWLAEQAAQRGVRIALENLPCQHQYSYRMEEIVSLVERSGAKNVGICLDSGHVNCSGLDVATAIRTAGPHLATTHFHDNLGGGDPRLPISKTDLHLCVGLGTINWPATIRALNASPYKGPAVIEGARIAPKTSQVDDWQKSIEMCIANFRAAEALAEMAL